MNLLTGTLLFLIFLLILTTIRSGASRAYRSRKTNGVLIGIAIIGVALLIFGQDALGGLTIGICALILTIGWMEQDKHREDEP